MSWDQIPAELTNLNQWVVWRYEEREGKRTKVPYQTHGGRLASSTKPETWAPFAAAKAAAEGYDGIGFVFREEGGIVGIDLDGCRDAAGEVESWAWEWVMKLQSYTEVTPSGRGLHVLVHGQVPQGMKRGQVEMYDRGRYFTVTGERLENLPEVLHNREAVVMEMYEAFARPVAPSPPRSLAVNGAAPDQWSVIEKVLGSAKGGPLWRGSTADYESHSSADAALCEIIAYYAGPDSALIDQVFRQSGLYRPEKWDRPGDSYSGRTIDFVLKNRSGSPFYQWQPEAASRRTGGSTSSLNSLNSLADADEGWPAALAPEAFHGPAGEIVGALAPETEADPAALLLNLLITFGNAVGRGPYAPVGATRHGANLFGVLIGYTGEARKGTSWDPIKDLFERALPTYMKEHRHGGIASGEGLLALVRDRQEKRVQIKDKKSGRMTMDFETVIEDEGVPDKRALIIEAEMSSLWKVMTRPGNILAEQYQKAWESGELQNQNKNSPMRATGAHISMIGHSTPVIAQRLITEIEAASGFGNRFIYLLCKRAQLLPEGGDLPVLNSYVSSIHTLVELASEGLLMKRTETARLVWAAVYPLLTQAGVGMFGEMTARRAPIVLRLSLIYSLWDGAREIDTDHLLGALAVWERAEASVRYLFGDATGDPVADALHEAMKQRPEGATRTDLHGALGRNRPAAEIDRALTALVRAEKAVMREQKEGRHVTEIWTPASRAGGTVKGGRYLQRAREVLAG